MTAADRAAQLTSGLLAFSRKQILNPKPIELNDVVRNVQKLLRRLIGEDIELSTALSAGDLIVMADVGQIEQVLMNLAANARDAMPDGGRLSLSTQVMSLDGIEVRAPGHGQPGRYARIAVSDTGIGMDEPTRESVFEPFFTTKTLGKGTGLGLAIVLGIVEQHGGTIGVHSEPGRGSTFEILLPLVATVVEEEGSAAPTPPATGNGSSPPPIEFASSPRIRNAPGGARESS